MREGRAWAGGGHAIAHARAAQVHVHDPDEVFTREVRAGDESGRGSEQHFQVTRCDSAHMKVGKEEEVVFFSLSLPDSLPVLSRCRPVFISPGVFSPSCPIYPPPPPHPASPPLHINARRAHQRLIKRPCKSRRNSARQPRQDE